MPAQVLIVDDERNIQVMLALALKGEHHAVETASGGREARQPDRRAWRRASRP